MQYTIRGFQIFETSSALKRKHQGLRQIATGLDNVTAEKGSVQESLRLTARKHRVTLRLFDQCEQIFHRTSKMHPYIIASPTR